jgi:molecular chaperone DnaK (HSP70)
MAEVAGEGRSKAQLIVGIDFGTTFSGVAFAFATNTEAKEDIITEWPGAGNQTKQKVSASPKHGLQHVLIDANRSPLSSTTTNIRRW